MVDTLGGFWTCRIIFFVGFDMASELLVNMGCALVGRELEALAAKCVEADLTELGHFAGNPRPITSGALVL